MVDIPLHADILAVGAHADQAHLDAQTAQTIDYQLAGRSSTLRTQNINALQPQSLRQSRNDGRIDARAVGRVSVADAVNAALARRRTPGVVDRPAIYPVLAGVADDERSQHRAGTHGTAAIVTQIEDQFLGAAETPERLDQRLIL